MAKKNLISGIGFSQDKDPYKAAKDAASAAVAGLQGKTPTLSLVFYAGQYDPFQINDACKEIFGTTDYVGGSTDAVIYKSTVAPQGIVVCSLYSDYLHFGIASADNVSKDPYKIAQKTAAEAVNKIHLDKYLNSYIQFTRMKKSNIENLIRIPSFFCLVFTRGYQQNKMGNEDLIIQGVSETIGSYIPLFGGSLGNDMDKVFKQETYDIISFHSGKVMKDGLVTVFACTGLVYNNSIDHGGEPKGTLGYISKTSGGGFVVESICGKPIKKWYAEILGIKDDEFNSKLLFYTQKYPLGFPDGYGNIVMRAGGVPYKDHLSYIAPFKENTPVWVMNIENNKKVIQAPERISKDIENHLKKKLTPQLSFLVSCSSRRRVLDPADYKKEIEKLGKMSPTPIFGFCSFGEIGSKPAQQAHFHHLCTNLFNFYNEMLSEL
jgi:hypothetical protein